MRFFPPPGGGAFWLTESFGESQVGGPGWPGWIRCYGGCLRPNHRVGWWCIKPVVKNGDILPSPQLVSLFPGFLVAINSIISDPPEGGNLIYNLQYQYAVSTGTQGSRRLYMSCVRKNIKVVDNSWTNSIKVCYKWIPVVVCPHCFFLTKHWPSATVGTKKQNGSSTCPKHLSQTSSFLTFTNSVYEVYMMPFLSDVFPKLYIQPSNQSPTKPKVSLLVRCSIAQSTVGSSNCQRMLGLSNPLSKKPSKKKGATV